MITASKKEPLLLFVGDIIILLLSVWLGLFLRYFELPPQYILIKHLEAFGVLSIIWTFVFFIGGLYEKQTMLLRSRLPNTIFNTLIANGFVSVLFFYVFSYFGIEPKTNLFVYFITASILIFIWRLRVFWLLQGKVRTHALLIGEGKEADEVVREVNSNPRYQTRIVLISKPTSDDLNINNIKNQIEKENISVIIADLENNEVEGIISELQQIPISKPQVIGLLKLYEDIFDRIPLSLFHYRFFIENISFGPKIFYDAAKRLMDVIIATVLFLVSLLFYPAVFLAIKIDDGGPVFITQERIGKDNNIIKLYKFRSMTRSDSGVWINESKNKVTRVGGFLRNSRIDELPQLWNVLVGDISLIGPRPDIIDLGRKLAVEIPYYTIRNLIKPGLSGWAQIKQELPPQSVEETKTRLSYDLYYIKNRSFLLDIGVALKTIRILLLRTGK